MLSVNINPFPDPAVNRVLDFSIYKHRVRRLIQRLGRALRLREDKTDCFYLSIKLVSYKDQILPRKYLESKNGILSQDIKELKAISVEHTQYHAEGIKIKIKADDNSLHTVLPSSAKLKLPGSNEKVNIGNPPNESNASEQKAAAEQQAQPTELNFSHDPGEITDIDFDDIFMLLQES